MARKPENPVDIAAKAVGGQSRLARLLETTPQAVQKWKRTRIPAERVLYVAKASGISARVLRADLPWHYVG